MRHGIAAFAGSGGLRPPELARTVEERGFESLFYTEHTHIPVATRRRDGSPATHYADTYDPFVALAGAAAVTTTLTLGTSVVLVTQRDPIVTAKAVSSLDHMAQGRFQFGVGAGWNRLEMANHGTDPTTRMALLADRVRAMRAIWLHDEAEYHGRFVEFAPLWSWPKPVQQPPPVLVGGNGPSTEDRVLDIGDGWLPQWGLLEGVAELAGRATALRQRAVEAGRPRPSVTLFGVPPEPDVIATIDDTGVVDRCLFAVPNRTTDEALSWLDKVSAAVGR